MEGRKIMAALLAVLAATAAALAIFLAAVYRSINYLPEEALDDLADILRADSIYFDKSAVSLKRERGTIYVCGSEGYRENVARQLGGSEIRYRFLTPEGELMLLENGAAMEFTSAFSFQYRIDQNVSYPFPSTGEVPKDAAAKEASDLVVRFLDEGSLRLDDEDALSLVTEVSEVYEADGVLYVACVRTIDGLAITENRVVCAVRDGRVEEAKGRWCFLTLGSSYSSQLTDVLNILFHVKREIDRERENGETSAVTVTEIDRCYTLYYLGDEEGFCFIPCWQIVTDRYGTFIYNAIDGILYTKNER